MIFYFRTIIKHFYYLNSQERLSQFITTTKHEIINLKADLRNRERLAEEKREKYRIERKEYL